MSCERFKEKMMGYLDDELSAEDRAAFERHLAECESCGRELDEFTRLKEDLEMVEFREPTDVELERYWGCVYNRLERGLGWILFSVGAILVLSYGGFLLVDDLICDPAVAPVLKVGVCALVLGVVILVVSVARERLTLCKADRYSKEVQR